MNQPTNNNRPTGRAAAGAPARLPRPVCQPNPAGDWPSVHPTAYVHPSAQLIGNVHVGKHVFVGPGAILRADETGPDGRTAPVVVAPGCNIQDGVVVHALGGTSVRIATKTSLSHGCIVHGPCQIGRGSFIGFRSVVFDARLGCRVYVGAGSIVQGTDLDDEVLVRPGICLTAPPRAGLLARTSPKERLFMRRVIRANLRLARDYRR